MMKMILLNQIWFMLLMICLSVLINLIPSYYKLIHPIMIGIILLILCMFSSINIEIFNWAHWISYLMYLIVIGGLMIIFLYFTSFINNMKMSFKLNFFIMLILKIMLFMIFMIFMIYKFSIFYPWYNLNIELMNFSKQINFKIVSMYMYMYNKNYSFIFCMIYLLMILMFIVKMCINKKFSLRKIN